MRLRATWAAVLFGAVLCLFNATGRDPHNLFFFMFSVPVWFAAMFTDIHKVSVEWMYVLTILTYAGLGFLIDLGVARLRYPPRQ